MAKLGISKALATSVVQVAAGLVEGEGLSMDMALQMGLNQLLPGSGETVDASQEALDIILNEISDGIMDADNYGHDENQPVWKDPSEVNQNPDDENFDPDTGGLLGGYDPDLIDPQLPEFPNDEDGGGGGGDTGGDTDSETDEETGGDTDAETGGDTGGETGGEETQGQYEVIGQNPDGSWVVRDNVDGDIWIVVGDHNVGDILDESEMVDARGQEGALDNDGVDDTDDTNDGDDSDGEDEEEEEEVDPTLPVIPGYDPIDPNGGDTTDDTTGGDTTGGDNTGDTTGGDTTGGDNTGGDDTGGDNGGDNDGDSDGDGETDGRRRWRW